MTEQKRTEWLNINEPRIHRQLFDKFGNRFNQLVVEEYHRNCNREWVKQTCINGSANYYLVDGKLYWRAGDRLMPCETDFDNEQLNVCWKVVDIITDFTRITGNTILFENKCRQLKRQDYSDGTCFYTLHEWVERPYPHYERDFRVDEGADNLQELISEMKRQNALHYDWIEKYPKTKDIVSQHIKDCTQLIDFMESLLPLSA